MSLKKWFQKFGLVWFFVVFTEEIAFKHFLFTNITKFRGFFCDGTQALKSENLLKIMTSI